MPSKNLLQTQIVSKAFRKRPRYQINVGSFSLVACVLNLVSRLVLTGAAHEAMHGSVIPQQLGFQFKKTLSVGLLKAYYGMPSTSGFTTAETPSHSRPQHLSLGT